MLKEFEMELLKRQFKEYLVLKKIYESLDMVKLRQKIEELLDELINLRIRTVK